MTKDQKAALRFAYDALRGRFNDRLATLPGVHVLNHADVTDHPRLNGNGHQPAPDGPSRAGIWLEPDRDPERLYLNEAVFAALVMRGFMECQRFAPASLWLYRITPEGCTAIGRVYPGTPPSPQPPLKKLRRHEDPHRPPGTEPDHLDPHRFRRSPDWRRQ